MTDATEPERASRPPALCLEGVSVRASGRLLLDRVSLSLQPGARVGMVGPSGAGKSTLLDVAAGERAVTSGRVLLGGKDVTRWPLWRRATYPKAPACFRNSPCGTTLRCS
jgi:ABC-type hemin transport system ATPase subunit